ncbi:hypothetical protein D3C81_703960 [compost metagenome]
MKVEASSSDSPINAMPIKLENPMKAFKTIHFILIPVGAITLAAMGGAVGALFGAVIGWTTAYLSMQFISGIKLLKLNFKDYPLAQPLTDDQLYEHLSSLSLHSDLKVEKGTWGVRFIFKNTTMHRIRINKDKQVYSIVSKLTKKKIIKRRHNPGVVEYTHAFTAIPYIKHAIQMAAAEETPSEVI